MDLKEFNRYMDKSFEILIDSLCPKQKTLKDDKN